MCIGQKYGDNLPLPRNHASHHYVLHVPQIVESKSHQLGSLDREGTPGRPHSPCDAVGGRDWVFLVPDLF